MLNPFYYPYAGGTEKHLLEVCTRLAKKHDVTVLTAMLQHTARREDFEGVHIVRMPAAVLYSLPHPLPPPVPLLLFPWPDLAAEAKKADVIHIHNRFVYGLTDVFIAKKIFKKPLALTLHNARPQGIDIPTDLAGGFYDDAVGRKIMYNCDLIAGVSKNTLDITVPPEFKGRKTVIYNGVEPHLFEPGKNDAEAEALKKDLGLEGKKIVLTVSRLVEQKGLDFLFDAIPEILAEEKEAHFILLGRGPRLEHLKKKAEQMHFSDKISFLTERFSEKNLAALYAAADCFSLPSLWEPFGIVFVEALSSGKPVVGTDVGGIPEIVENGKTGFLVPTRNSRAIAEKIIFLLQNPSEAGKMGVEGRKTVLKKFTWDETAKGYEKLYSKI